MISLEDYARDLKNSVRFVAGNDESESFLVEAFMRVVLDRLAEAGEIEDAEVCSHPGHGFRLNGYEINTDEESLDLFVAVHTDEAPPHRVEKSRVDTAVKQLASFYEKCANGLFQKMEETAPAFMLAQQIFLIHNSQGGFSRIRFFAITDGISKLEQAPPAPVIGNVEVTVHIWC